MHSKKTCLFFERIDYRKGGVKKTSQKPKEEPRHQKTTMAFTISLFRLTGYNINFSKAFGARTDFVYHPPLKY